MRRFPVRQSEMVTALSIASVLSLAAPARCECTTSPINSTNRTASLHEATVVLCRQGSVRIEGRRSVGGRRRPRTGPWHRQGDVSAGFVVSKRRRAADDPIASELGAMREMIEETNTRVRLR